MMRRLAGRILGLLWAGAWLPLAGCVSPQPHLQTVGDITPARQLRKADMVRDFEEQRDRAQLESAVFHRDHGDTEACQKTLQEILHRNPQHREARFLLAELHFLNVQLTEARTLLETLVAEEPGEARFQHLLGLVLDLDGDKARSTTHLRRAVELAPENAIYRASYEAPAQKPGSQATHPAITEAVAALRQDQPLRAIQLLQAVSPDQSVSASHHRTLGTAYYRAGDYRAAETQFGQALALDNASALSYFLMGCTLSRQGRAEDAAANFRQAASLDPRYGQPR